MKILITSASLILFSTTPKMFCAGYSSFRTGFQSMKRPLALVGTWRVPRTRQNVHTGSALHSIESSSTEAVDSSSSSSFASSYHAPVMWRECIDALMGCQRASNRRDDHRENGPLIFVDATLGGGGHSAAILEQLQPGDVLFGCDVDSNALETATARLKKYVEPDPALPLFVPVQSNFCDLLQELPKSLHPTTEQTLLSSPTACIDGILLDLGVSSHQIDTAERGFAFMKDGPLDMRMGISASSSMTAADICNEFEERQLRQILKVYGDEPRAKRIAQSIVQHRPLSTTQDLRNAIADVTPDFSKKGRRMGRTATLARVFQSLRIVVNQEDAVLQRVLEDVCPTLVRPGGRLVVLSYHSMEDRFTKRVMRDGVVQAVSTNQDDRDIYGNYIGRPKPWKSVGKRRKASEEEVELNSRARSATLRVAERSDT